VRLDSWKDIAGYLKRDESTVQRWEKREDMPVHRHVHDKRGSVYAFTTELDAWWYSRLQQLEAKETGSTKSHADGASAVTRQRPDRLGRWVLVGGSLALTTAILAYTLSADRRTIRTIAVLPLQNLSGDPTQEYFADGMTDALIGRLAQVRALHVVSRTSVMRFKGSLEPLPKIAQELGVEAILEGSVQRAGGRVSIKVQLIHAPSDTSLWAAEYEREARDILMLQGEVARAVADEIRIQVTPQERARLASAAAVDPAAHQEYLIAHYHLWKYNEHDLAQAIVHLQRAIEIDPNYAAAYAGLSHAWWARGIFGARSFAEAQAASRAAAWKALELDDRRADAQVALGRVKYTYDWDWAGAEAHFDRALSIDPNNLDAHYFSAMLFMGLGRFEESIALMQRAEQLDPLSSTVQSGLGRIFYRARKFEEAVEPLKRAIALEPRNFAAYGRLADVYEAMGNYPEALASLDRAAALRPGRQLQARRARVYARMGRKAEAREMIRTLVAGSPALPLVAAAGVYAALGETNEAFNCLFRLVDQRQSREMAVFVDQDPPFDSLRSDPRWKTLASRLNFPRDAQRVGF
jgi:TolB-like protein